MRSLRQPRRGRFECLSRLDSYWFAALHAASAGGPIQWSVRRPAADALRAPEGLCQRDASRRPARLSVDFAPTPIPTTAHATASRRGRGARLFIPAGVMHLADLAATQDNLIAGGRRGAKVGSCKSPPSRSAELVEGASRRSCQRPRTRFALRQTNGFEFLDQPYRGRLCRSTPLCAHRLFRNRRHGIVYYANYLKFMEPRAPT